MRKLRWTLIGMLLLSFCLAALVPVYTDEIGWRLQMRAGIDGVDIMFNDICGPNTLAHPAWFMWPARWFSAFANQALSAPIFVRASGVVCAAIWIGLFALLLRTVGTGGNRQARIQIVLLSLLGMGWLPFLMVLSRPEQPVILCITGAVLIALAPQFAGTARLNAWIKVVLILLLAAVAMSYHIKGILYSVVILATLLACARGRDTVAARGVGIIATLGLTASAALYWTERFQCLGDERLKSMLGQENIAAVLASGGSVSDLALMAVHGAIPFNYIELIVPSQWPMAFWLPPEIFPMWSTRVFFLLIYATWIAALTLTALALMGNFRKEGWRFITQPKVQIIGALLGCVLVWGASQLNKNVYEASHILPMLLIAFAISWSLPTKEKTDGAPIPMVLTAAFALAAIASQALLLAFTTGPLMRAAQTPGYPRSQPVSVSLVGYASVERDIKNAMLQAGIPVDRPLQRLLIDDLTYLALQKHHLPLHNLGVLSTWNGNIDDPVAYLRSRNSDGVIVGCQYLPSEMAEAASRAGGICAISRTGLELLASKSDATGS